MAQPPDLRRNVAKEVRLWVLALVCAAAGATAVSVTDSLPIGIFVFLGTLAVLGPLLFAYEKRQRNR